MRNKSTSKRNNKGIGFTSRNSVKQNNDTSIKVRVRTAKGRKLSSTNWLRRQLNDPFVKLARQAGFRGRAAFKLLEIDEKFSIFKPGDTVLDLGSAPGGWAQVAVDKTNADKKKIKEKQGRVLGIDLKPVLPISGAEFYVFDFLEDGFYSNINEILSEPADVIISDLTAIVKESTDSPRTA